MNIAMITSLIKIIKNIAPYDQNMKIKIVRDRQQNIADICAKNLKI